MAALKRYINSHPAGRHVAEANAAITALQAAPRQDARPIEGTVESMDHRTRTLRLRTSMGQTEDLRVSEDTLIQQEGKQYPLSSVTESEGVRIDYVNLPDGRLFAKQIALGYSVSHCSCGDSCRCLLSRGCRTIRY